MGIKGKEREEQMGQNDVVKMSEKKISKVMYIEHLFTLCLITEFNGPDGFNRSMTVTGMGTIETAKRFLEFMGYNDLPFEIVKFE
jgi:hypothetical protein